MDPGSRERTRQPLMGIPIDPFTMKQALQQCIDAIEHKKFLSIGVVNAAKIMTMRRDERLRKAVCQCHMILADGQSVVWASRLLQMPLPERVAGIDLFQALLEDAAQHHRRVFFLGARPDVLARMLEEIGRRFPGLMVAGSRDGYYRPEDEAKVAAEIRDAQADLLFLGMSSPKKELFLSQWGDATGASVVHGVGGSFDILAGITQRAPAWYQEHGLEWFYRVRQEPLRLGRRYLVTNTSFLTLLAREMVRQRLTSRAAREASQPPRGAGSPTDYTTTGGERP